MTEATLNNRNTIDPLSEGQEFLSKLFLKAGKVHNRYGTPEEKKRYQLETGVRRFKREVLGLCGKSSIKSLDELAGTLVKIGIANSLSEAKELVPQMVTANSHCYVGYCVDRNPGGSDEYIHLEPVEGPDSSKYRITHRWVLSFL